MLLIKEKYIEYYDIYRKKIIKGDLKTVLFFTDEMKAFSPLNQYFIFKVFHERTWQSYKTIEVNAQHLLDFFIYLEDNGLSWKNLNNGLLTQWRDNIKEMGITGKPLSNKTVNARLQAVISFYEFAIESGFIETNPFTFKNFNVMAKNTFNQKNIKISKYKAIAKLQNESVNITVPTMKEIKSFLELKMPIETKLMSLLMYETGMRRNEVYTITESAISKIQVNNQNFFNIYLDNKEMETKNLKNRTVVIGKSLLILLKDWISSNKRMEKVEKYKEKHGLETKRLFITSHGNEYKNDTLNTSIEKVCKKQNYTGTKITPHILRHSFATHNLFYNLSKFDGSEEKMLYWISNRLGHSNTSTTRDHYIHFVNELKIKEQKVLTDFEKEIKNLGGINEK